MRILERFHKKNYEGAKMVRVLQLPHEFYKGSTRLPQYPYMSVQ